MFKKGCRYSEKESVYSHCLFNTTSFDAAEAFSEKKCQISLMPLDILFFLVFHINKIERRYLFKNEVELQTLFRKFLTYIDAANRKDYYFG